MTTLLVIKVLPSPQANEEAANQAAARNQEAAEEGRLIDATYILAAIGAFQLFVFAYQAIQLKNTVHATKANADAIISGERAWMHS